MTQGPTVVTPPRGYPVVGMVGGGQLARMSQQAAIALGVGFTVLAARPDDSAARVVHDVMVGDPDDPEALAAFGRVCDVVTFDHEQVPAPGLAALATTGAEIRPGPDALVHAQDKIVMRQALTDLGAPCPSWLEWGSDTTVAQVETEIGWPAVVKTSRGGYDGRGVWVVADAEELARVLAQPLAPGSRWLIEQYIPFTAELSAQVARSPHGQAVAYPVVQTLQVGGICKEVIAPAPGLDPDVAVAAQELALRIAGTLGVVGMLAVEMFATESGVVVNELAMRPHNSGHWSIEGAVTSQFENHLRAVLDLPLGSPAPVAPWTVMVNVLGGDHDDMYRAYRHVMARDPGLHVHMYGKDVRPGRKIGHVTVSGSDLDDLLARARHAADYLTGVIDE
ncbi:MAG: 5-(carboxyamino)imidazole ribonucleotide synthase [Candidatus Nanopelagicales bacterium]